METCVKEDWLLAATEDGQVVIQHSARLRAETNNSGLEEQEEVLQQAGRDRPKLFPVGVDLLLPAEPVQAVFCQVFLEGFQDKILARLSAAEDHSAMEKQEEVV